MKKLSIVLSCTLVLLGLLATQTSFAQVVVFDQGFELNTDGWSPYNGSVDRVASGTDGITSSAGDWHANLIPANGGPYTFFGGTSSEFLCGYETYVDVYINVEWPEGVGFDYSVAAYNQDETHLRDFIWHVGTVAGYDGVIVNADNNSYGGGAPNAFILLSANDGNFYEITTSGWYTFKHVFKDVAGVLAVDLELYDDAGTLLHTITRSNPADLISTVVGGNGYGWFVFTNVSDYLSIDESKLLYCSPTTYVDLDIKPGSWPNPINVKSKGVVPVAILGTEVFDVYSIDPASLMLEGVSPLTWDYEDVGTPAGNGWECNDTEEGPDGFVDLTLKFKTQELVAALGDVEDGDELILNLTGSLMDGSPLGGDDCVVIIKNNDKEAPAEITDEAGLTVYPNPFANQARIALSMQSDQEVDVSVYNLNGVRVSTLVKGYLTKGEHLITWEGKSETGDEVSYGIYVVKVVTDGFVSQKTLIKMQ